MVFRKIALKKGILPKITAFYAKIQQITVISGKIVATHRRLGRNTVFYGKNAVFY